MRIRPSARRKTLYLLGSFLGLVVAPLWLWAVRAPDPAYAPLPDYDIRKGYSGLTGVSDPRIAQEHLRLRQQRAAKLALVGEKWEAAPAAPEHAETEAAFGRGVSAQWNENGTVASLTAGERPLSPPQAGDPEAAARQFLRTHQLVLGLDEATIASLQAIPRGVSAPDGEVIVFRQTVTGVPVYQAELKVSLRADNAVEGVAGTVYPALSVSPAARLSVVEAAGKAAAYAGPWKKKLDAEAEAPASPAGSQWTRLGAQGHEVLATEPGPEEVTTLSPGGFRREVRASRVVFPLTASQGREAWQVYLMKSPLESYRLVVDAEDGTLLNRTSLVKFAEPQGLVFPFHPDAGPQEIRSFVGNPSASRKTFVTGTQTGLLGNNVIMGIGANDTSGSRHFEFAFTDDYESSGGILNDFNLNGATLQFVPNASLGYDFSAVSFFDPGPGTNTGVIFDDAFNCSLGPVPSGFKFFGATVSSVCVSTNGNLTINTGDANFFENQLDLALGPGRIMGLWDDLNPAAGGTIDRIATTGMLCFTWNGVPEFGVANSNTFSICLFGTGNSLGLPAGTIRLSYPSVAALDGMMGIAPGKTGKGLPRSAGWSDFSAPASTIGANGLARLFPDHDDAAAAATNVFWAFNELGHDREYLFGFNEKFRNMQWKNFLKKRGRIVGLGKDPVVAASGFVLDGFFFNNAFFATSPEGVCCPFSAFGLFTAADGFRDVDSAFDTDVVVHEYGHGVSTRLVGALDTLQGGAMGEGWSDWFALDYSGDPVMGEYVTGNPTTGIRTVAYNSSSPRHLGQYGNLLGPFTFEDFFGPIPGPATNGTIFIDEPHIDGEIWATMLADLRTALLGTGVSASNVSKLIILALKKTPANPSMLQGRNALLTAAGTLGLNKCTFWQVFAENGFGRNAANNEAPTTGLSGDNDSIFQSFDRDTTCGGSFSTGTLIHSTNFDGALVGDTSADGWTGTGLWHVTARRASSGTQSFYYGQEATGNYNTGLRNQGTLTSPLLDLSIFDRPVIEFAIRIRTEQLFPFDTIWVRVSTDSGATYPIQVAQLFWNTPGTGFRTMRIDLEPLAGLNNVRVQFYFDSIDDGFFSDPNDNNFEGVYIDNIVIRNYTEN